jgi:decaprenylphospho-beta-D-erythro-pentofuranosid-2-ulose 2-reductase
MTVLIIGATSDIAIALARHCAANGHNLQLAGRDTDQIGLVANDLVIRFGCSATVVELNALDFKNHFTQYNKLETKPDVAVMAVGYLGDQDKAIIDWNECQQILQTNYLGPVSLLNVIANDFEKRRSGTIVGISSVAGDRGRMSNYLYGSAKAGFTAYLSGLRNRLYHSGVHVLTVNPGFVRTKMTEKLRLPPIITGGAKEVAEKIYKAILKKQNVLYVLPIWSLLMLVIRNIPEAIFKRMRL